jgi:protein-S-isoprenylcysteine O-methyltransferase Ste14
MTFRELIEEIKDGDWSDRFYQNHPFLAQATAIILGVGLVWVSFFLVLWLLSLLNIFRP